MRYYAITRNTELVGITTANAYSFNLPDVSIHEFDGIIPDLNVTVWDFTIEELVERPAALTTLMFLNRFTFQERTAIRGSEDPVVVDIMYLLDAATYVSVTDNNTIQGLGYLAMIGLIAQSRLPEILA
jgi:hypothetical protein